MNGNETQIDKPASKEVNGLFAGASPAMRTTFKIPFKQTGFCISRQNQTHWHNSLA
jgi:hypothetical protein